MGLLFLPNYFMAILGTIGSRYIYLGGLDDAQDNLIVTSHLILNMNDVDTIR